MFNGQKGDGDPEGELPEGDNGEGHRENSEGDNIASKGQRAVLKGESPSKGEPVFVSPISVLRSIFPTNTKNNKQFLPLNKLSDMKGIRKEQGNRML